MGAKFFGAAVKRREDPRFLQGEGRFVDDVVLPGMLHAAFLRSPHAHARIVRIDTTAAASAPGVVRVLAFADLERWMKPLPLFGAVPPGLGAVVKFDVRQAPQWALCRERARHVGEIVAMVVADSPERAQDAVELIRVEWDLLPPVVDMRRAAELVGFARGEPAVAQSFRREGASHVDSERIAVDVDALRPGRYRLVVEITDLHNGSSAVAHTPLVREASSDVSER